MDQDCVKPSGGGLRVSADVEARQRIAEEHHALGELLDRLEVTADPNLLAVQLAELERLLIAHFAREEGEDGLHDMVGDAAPHLLAGVQRLFDEHRRISARLAACAPMCTPASTGRSPACSPPAASSPTCCASTSRRRPSWWRAPCTTTSASAARSAAPEPQPERTR